VATTVSVAAAPARTAAELAAELEPEPEAAPARPQFEEMREEPAYPPQPRDYASDFGSVVRDPDAAGEQHPHGATALFTEPDEEAQRDLDTPTFLRRLRF
jgi:hypothetical protein